MIEDEKETAPVIDEAATGEAESSAELDEESESPTDDGDDGAVDEGTEAEPDEGDGKGVQRRIDKLTYQKHESARKATQYRLEAEHWRRVALGEIDEEGRPIQGAERELKRPKLEDFGYDSEKYEAAIDVYEQRMSKRRVAETFAKAKAMDALNAANVEQSLIVGEFSERESEFKAQAPDYEKVAYAEDLDISPVMVEAIRRIDEGPALAYHLGKNPREATRISRLSPAMQLYELGRISSKLGRGPNIVATGRVSAAPAPAPRIEGGRQTGGKNRLRDDLPTDVWIKRREKQVRSGSS